MRGKIRLGLIIILQKNVLSDKYFIRSESIVTVIGFVCVLTEVLIKENSVNYQFGSTHCIRQIELHSVDTINNSRRHISLI